MSEQVLNTRNIQYHENNTVFEGTLITPQHANNPATVLVFPDIRGRTDEQLQHAKKVAQWGYQCFAVDLYGKDTPANTSEECYALMHGLLDDRSTLQARLHPVLDTVAQQPEVNASAIAAMGFCFGGLCVLDLARTAADVVGVASFHGRLTAPQVTPDSAINAKVIVYHGWDDPLVPQESVTDFAAEMTKRQADWQLLAYSQTQHSFMSPDSNKPEKGLVYNERTAKRAWLSFEQFLLDCFADKD